MKDAEHPQQLWLQVLSNEAVAGHLDEIAELLEGQGANPFRVRAYRTAAETLRALKQPVPELLREEGVPGLLRLPGIGRSLARAIEHLLHTGKLPLLERLRGESEPERIFTTVAAIGPKMAQRIHESLDIETLADLEAAAWDGRLAKVPGMGAKRVLAVRESLAGRFRNRRPARPAAAGGTGPSRAQQSSPSDIVPAEQQPPVEELLDVDQQYRRLAEDDRLPRIAPKRFNPQGQAWLPILHTQRHDRHYTALYSNTARAHELGTTHDWVVLYRDDHEDGQWTVVTSAFGKLKGRRIVRGREPECAALYGVE